MSDYFSERQTLSEKAKNKCPWLMGEIPPAPGRRQFVASLEWITNENNFAKIIEGEYDPERGGE